MIRFDPTQGAEIGKTRPAVVVNPNSVGRLPLRIVVPVTGWKHQYAAVPWLVQIKPARTNGLRKASAADCFQVSVYLAGAVCIEDGGPARKRNRRNRRRNRVVRGGLVEQRKSMHTVTFYNAISRDERLV